MRALVVSVVMVVLVAGLVSPGPATADVLNTTVPFVGTYANPCTGELIAFLGDVHILVGQSIAPDGEIELTLHSNFQAVQGTGVLTGNLYQIPADMGLATMVGLPPATATLGNDFRVVGDAGNFLGSLPLNVSIGAGGGLNTNVGALQLVCG